MTDKKLIEGIARAIATVNMEPFTPDWELYVPDATAALKAYRDMMGDDGK